MTDAAQEIIDSPDLEALFDSVAAAQAPAAAASAPPAEPAAARDGASGPSGNVIARIGQIQGQIETGAAALKARWDELFENRLGVDEFKQLVQQTRDYLGALPQQTGAAKQQLLEITMAQDLREVAGQVIEKFIELKIGN